MIEANGFAPFPIPGTFTACAGGTGEAEFTDAGMFCRYGFCRFGTLLVLVCDGVPVAAVFVLAIFARALRMLDVSGAPAPVFPLEPFKGMKSLGGVPAGVVDRGSTVH